MLQPEKLTSVLGRRHIVQMGRWHYLEVAWEGVGQGDGRWIEQGSLQSEQQGSLQFEQQGSL